MCTRVNGTIVLKCLIAWLEPYTINIFVQHKMGLYEKVLQKFQKSVRVDLFWRKPSRGCVFLMNSLPFLYKTPSQAMREKVTCHKKTVLHIFRIFKVLKSNNFFQSYGNFDWSGTFCLSVELHKEGSAIIETTLSRFGSIWYARNTNPPKSVGILALYHCTWLGGSR